MEAIVRFQSEREAEEYGSKLPLEKDVTIEDSQIVEMLGPAFLECLTNVWEARSVVSDSDAWVRTEDGFLLRCVSYEVHEDFSLKLVQLTKEIFDLELASAEGRIVTARAGAALELLRGNDLTKPEIDMTRSIVAARVLGDSDRSTRLLELGAARLGVTVDIIQRRVAEYEQYSLASRFRPPPRDPCEVLVVQERRGVTVHPDEMFSFSFSQIRERGPLAVRARNVLLEKSKGSLVEILLGDFYRVKHFVNGIGVREYGECVGKFIAEGERSSGGEDIRLDALWGALFDASKYEAESVGEKALSADSDARLIPLYAVSGMARYKSETRWMMNDEDLNQALSHRRLNAARTSARKVSALMRKFAGRITAIESAFPEDSTLLLIAKDVFRHQRLIELEVMPQRGYGSMEFDWHGAEGDFGIFNELIPLSVSKRGQAGVVFRHCGYFAFARRSYVVQSLGEDCPDAFRRWIDGLIEPGVDEVGDSDGRSRELAVDDVLARVWLALRKPMRLSARSEYDAIHGWMVDILKERGHDGDLAELVESEGFGRDFEDFLRGRIEVFWGGSVHARLLHRWWMKYSDEFVEILNPGHFEWVVNHSHGRGLDDKRHAPRHQAIRWPLGDQVVFADSWQDRRYHELRTHVTELLELCAKFLHWVGHESRHEDGDALRILRYLTAHQNLQEQSHREWTFISDPQDMLNVLTVDNIFSSSIGTSRRGS